jgi:benzoyl-CoA 2,3-dioxygenase component B
MLTEEAHHMFVGQTGVARVIEKTCAVMKEHPGQDVKSYGAIPLETIQRYINFWSSSSTDLFGAEISSNSANFFGAGLKGRAFEGKWDEHTALDRTYAMERFVDKKLRREEVPLRNAMNEVLRDAYVQDNEKGIDYWNRVCERAGIEFRFRLPHRRFHRKIGEFAAGRFDLDGRPIDEATWNAHAHEWLPTAEDKSFVKSLMVPCTKPGTFASWIAAPAKGINGSPADFEYVKLGV